MPSPAPDKETWASDTLMVLAWAVRDWRSWGWAVHGVLAVLVAIPVAGAVGWLLHHKAAIRALLSDADPPADDRRP